MKEKGLDDRSIPNYILDVMVIFLFIDDWMVGKQERADLQQYKQIIFTVSISIFIVISRIRFGRTGRKHSNLRSYKNTCQGTLSYCCC